MGAARRETYRMPTKAEAAEFAATHRAWRKMRRRQGRRLAAQWVASALLVACTAALGALIVWLLAVFAIVLFDAIVNR
jgi:fatty acid desaturase